MKGIAFLLLMVFFVGLPGVMGAESAESDTAAGKCITCHKEETPGLYRQWFNSIHAVGDVTCIDCHGAKKEDADGFMHYEALIATLVTPNDYLCHLSHVCHKKAGNNPRCG